MGHSSPHILVVDDEPEIGRLIGSFFTGHGFEVSTAVNGAEGRAALREHTIDLVLLDLGLPDEDGLVLLRDFQAQWRGPVIVVTGRGESVERIVGLELGADDYVSKPFELRELLARVRSVLRRTRGPAATGGSSAEASSLLRFEGFQLDVGARRLTDGTGGETPLTAGEFDLLLALLKRPNQVLSRDHLMNCLHSRDASPFDRSIDVQVGRLRRKIEQDPSAPRLIKSVRGAGYMFTATVRNG